MRIRTFSRISSKKKKKNKKEKEIHCVLTQMHRHGNWSNDLLKMFYFPITPLLGIAVYPWQPQTKGTGQVLEASELGAEEAREERSMIDGVLVGL